MAIVDDLVTKFNSKLLAKSQVEQEAARRKITGIDVKDFVVLLDREQGGAETARSLGLNLYSFIPFASKGLYWLKDRFSETEYDVLTDYLKDPAKYQDKELQTKLQKMAGR
jgi:orotate phosphoribosyltransferase